MSILAIVGVILAIVIIAILVRLGIEAFNKYVTPIDPFLVKVIWAVFTIICIFLIAYAVGIPIPYVRM